MEEGLAIWANPSSPHAEGRRAKAALEDARARVKAALAWPGEVIFTKGEPFCFIVPMEHGKLEEIVPERKLLSTNPDLEKEFRGWSESRGNFNKKLYEGDPDTLKAGWQRHYMRGQKQTGEKMDSHVTKRRLQPPKDVKA